MNAFLPFAFAIAVKDRAPGLAKTLALTAPSIPAGARVVFAYQSERERADAERNAQKLTDEVVGFADALKNGKDVTAKEFTQLAPLLARGNFTVEQIVKAVKAGNAPAVLGGSNPATPAPPAATPAQSSLPATGAVPATPAPAPQATSAGTDSHAAA